jgi:hypothetical protein
MGDLTNPTVPLMPFRPLRTLGFAFVVAIGFLLLFFSMTDDRPEWKTPGGWGREFAACMVYSVCTSFTIELLYAASRRLLGARMPRSGTWPRVLLNWSTPLVGLAISLPVAALLTGSGKNLGDAGKMVAGTPGNLAFILLQGALFYGYFAIRRRQLRAEKFAADAQLRLLQAQMEPHFLFNTLANVVGLMEVDTPRAKAMLESFTDYLRGSLVSLRTPEHALGAELDLIGAYLRVAKVRMEGRLSYRFDVPEPLRTLRIPALSLQPLVENAVIHGLEPSIEGGTLTVTAERVADQLVVRITDDGLGFGAAKRVPHPGNGTALANIRERLRQAHGERAGLRVEDIAPHGVQATLTLPATSITP